MESIGSGTNQVSKFETFSHTGASLDTPFSLLPDETLLNILNNCNNPELAKANLVCKGFRAVAESIWQERAGEWPDKPWNISAKKWVFWMLAGGKEWEAAKALAPEKIKTWLSHHWGPGVQSLHIKVQGRDEDWCLSATAAVKIDDEEKKTVAGLFITLESWAWVQVYKFEQGTPNYKETWVNKLSPWRTPRTFLCRFNNDNPGDYYEWIDSGVVVKDSYRPSRYLETQRCLRSASNAGLLPPPSDEYSNAEAGLFYRIVSAAAAVFFAFYLLDLIPMSPYQSPDEG